MCGIAGVNEPGADAVVARLLETLLHRGPDAWGIHAGKWATIGQTRLSVIDLATGDPPIENEDGSIGVALNGEIYNFAELRTTLVARGHRFRTAGDTEVIAHLAEDLEPVELARSLRGMFAFAIADDRRRRLVLGRDALGKKPLYYHWDGRRLVFGSELKAVLAHGCVPSDIDPSVIPSYLVAGAVPSPFTFFPSVRSLPPGHVLVLDDGGDVRLEAWYEPPVPGLNGLEHVDLSLADGAALVREELTAAVRRRLVADVPIGAFLSGGLDSSAVVAVMAELATQPVQTFTIGFDDVDGFDERPYARLVADRFATDHVEEVVHPDAVDLVQRLVHHYDEPFGDSSAIPTYLLSEVTRRHVTVALSGDGGDELFAGYERFVAVPALYRLRAVAPLLRPLSRARGRSGRMAARAALDLPDAWTSWLELLPAERATALTGRAPIHLEDSRRQRWAASDGAELLDRLLLLNLQTYLLEDLLPKADRMSMAHGLEVRSPFLDQDLLAAVAVLPPRLKATYRARKVVLREAMRDVVPAEILTRRKHGFGVPLDRWFRTDLRPMFEGTVLRPGARVAEHLQPAGVRALWSEHQAGRSHGHLLWALLTLEVFLRDR